MQIGSVQPAAVDTIRRVIDAQRPYWKCLSFAVDLPDQDVLRSPWLTDAQVSFLVYLDKSIKIALDILQ